MGNPAAGGVTHESWAVRSHPSLRAPQVEAGAPGPVGRGVEGRAARAGRPIPRPSCAGTVCPRGKSPVSQNVHWPQGGVWLVPPGKSPASGAWVELEGGGASLGSCSTAEPWPWGDPTQSPGTAPCAAPRPALSHPLHCPDHRELNWGLTVSFRVPCCAPQLEGADLPPTGPSHDPPPIEGLSQGAR